MSLFSITPPRLAAILALCCGIAPGRVVLGQATPRTPTTTTEAAETPPGPNPANPPAEGTVPRLPGASTPAPAGEPRGANVGPAPAAEPAQQPGLLFDNPSATPAGGPSYSSPNSLIGGTDPYIDSAIPRTQVRLRYDGADRDTRPDRAEFFYPQNGPMRASSQPVNFQEFSTYLEYAPLPNMSVFLDVPTRTLRVTPATARDGSLLQRGQNYSGFSDLQLGYKYAFITNPDYFYALQLRTYLPTGTVEYGMGSGHATIEPGFLAFHRLTERLYFAGEFKDWIPVQGTTDNQTGDPNRGRRYAGNVLNYGVGLFYNMVMTGNFRMAPTAEIVGWTALGGLEEVTPTTTKSSAGDTIINTMIGMRFSVGDYFSAGGGSQLNDRASVFVGYSRSLTGDWWYKDMLRVDFVWYF